MPDISGLECVEENNEAAETMEVKANVKIREMVEEYGSEFTFHPRVSSASSRIVNNLGMDFNARQQRHMERQKKMYELQPKPTQQNTAPGQPGIKRAKFTLALKENQDRLRPTTVTPRTPAPPYTSSPPSLPLRSKTYFCSSLNTAKGVQRKRSMNDPYNNMDRLQKAKLKAEKAIRNKKIFSIHGAYPLIRRGLRERGWVEKEFKLPPRSKVKDKGDSSDVDDDYDDDDDDQKDSGVGMSPRPAESDEDDQDPDNKYGIMGRMVRNEIPTFQWTTRNSSIDWRYLQKDQLVNHYAKANFTTKVGLCVNLRTLPCFADVDINSFFPRCYRLSQEEDKLDFIDDFRMTAATSILRVAVDRHVDGDFDEEQMKIGQKAVAGGSHTIPSSILQLAIQICELYAKERDHEDVDADESVFKISDEKWEQLLMHYYKLVHEGANFANSNSCFKQCEQALNKIKDLNLQFQTDGIMNTWIVKPGAKSRGRGIMVMNKLEEILKLVQCDPNLMKDGRWVIQKYIERPLLLYGTKYDIRQWFLVTDWNPMTIWMYKECYLRFSSRPFTLRNLEPCIHLCNYSVQKNYEVDAKRHPLLPDDNMWSTEDFKKYLKSRGCESLWDNLIYPGMQKAIIYMCKTAQDVVEYRKSSFELYGADFMIDENFNPWLIEINSSPTMARSTHVTSRMCAAVQEDVLKVVLDRRKDKNCNLGLFEMIYKQPTIDVPLYVGKSLQVEGVSIKKPGGQHNTIRRSWAGNNPSSQSLTVQRILNTSQSSNASHEQSKLIRTLSNHQSTATRNQTRIVVKTNVSVKEKPKLLPERSSSPVKLKMQSTMKRLSSETSHSKPNALNLPRFSSNSNLHSGNSVNVAIQKSSSHGSISRTNPSGQVHYVSTTQAKAASSMGIISNANYGGLIAAANRGSLPMRGMPHPPHQLVIPKTFPPSLVPGGDLIANGNTMSHQGPPSGVMAVAPQTIGLSLPLHKFFNGSSGIELPHQGVVNQRHLEIYNYPGQDFRLVGRQRMSGRLY